MNLITFSTKIIEITLWHIFTKIKTKGANNEKVINLMNIQQV